MRLLLNNLSNIRRGGREPERHTIPQCGVLENQLAGGGLLEVDSYQRVSDATFLQLVTDSVGEATSCCTYRQVFRVNDTQITLGVYPSLVLSRRAVTSKSEVLTKLRILLTPLKKVFILEVVEAAVNFLGRNRRVYNKIGVLLEIVIRFTLTNTELLFRRVDIQFNLVGATLDYTIRDSLTLQERIRDTTLCNTLAAIPNTTRRDEVHIGCVGVQLNLTTINGADTGCLVLQVVGLENLLVIQRVNHCREVGTDVTGVLSNCIVPSNADNAAIGRVVRQSTNHLAICVSNLGHLRPEQEVVRVILTLRP